MNKLLIGGLGAFVAATVTFVGVSFGSDVEPIEAAESSESTDDPDESPMASSEAPRHHRVTRPKQENAPPPQLGEPTPAFIELPTRLPKLTNHLPEAPVAFNPWQVRGPHEQEAMKLAEQTITVLVGHLARLEQAANADEGHRELMQMQRKLQTFERQWRPLQGQLSDAFKKELEDYARKRAGDVPRRIANAVQRFSNPRPPNDDVSEAQQLDVEGDVIIE